MGARDSSLGGLHCVSVALQVALMGQARAHTYTCRHTLLHDLCVHGVCHMHVIIGVSCMLEVRESLTPLRTERNPPSPSSKTVRPPLPSTDSAVGIAMATTASCKHLVSAMMPATQCRSSKNSNGGSCDTGSKLLLQLRPEQAVDHLVHSHHTHRTPSF